MEINNKASDSMLCQPKRRHCADGAHYMARQVLLSGQATTVATDGFFIRLPSIAEPFG